MHDQKIDKSSLNDIPDFMGAVYLKAKPSMSPGLEEEHVFITDNNNFIKMNQLLDQHYNAKEMPNTII